MPFDDLSISGMLKLRGFNTSLPGQIMIFFPKTYSIACLFLIQSSLIAMNQELVVKKPQLILETKEASTDTIDVIDFIKRVGIEPAAVYAVKANNKPLIMRLAQLSDLRIIKLEDWEINLLHLAARCNCNEAVQALIDLGFGLDNGSHSHRETPLYAAVSAGSLEALKVLLQAGADANCSYYSSIYDRIGISPLRAAMNEFLSNKVEEETKREEETKKTERKREILIILIDCNQIPLETVSKAKTAIEGRLLELKNQGQQPDYKLCQVYSLLNESLLGVQQLFADLPENNYLRLLPPEIRNEIRILFRLTFTEPAPSVNLPAPSAVQAKPISLAPVSPPSSPLPLAAEPAELPIPSLEASDVVVPVIQVEPAAEENAQNNSSIFGSDCSLL